MDSTPRGRSKGEQHTGPSATGIKDKSAGHTFSNFFECLHIFHTMDTSKEQAPLSEQQRIEQTKHSSDPTPPYSDFSAARHNLIVGMVSLAGFTGPLAGGIYLPALPVLQRDFHVGSTAINATVSVFMALCAAAPLVWSAFADWKGRKPLYIISLAIFQMANILLATLPANYGALLFLRMVQAFGCSAVISLGAGAIADVRNADLYYDLLDPSLTAS